MQVHEEAFILCLFEKTWKKASLWTIQHKFYVKLSILAVALKKKILQSLF